MMKLLKLGDYWVLEFYMFFGNGAFMDISAMWGVPFLEDVYKSSPSHASTIAMALSISTIVGSPLLPLIAHWTTSRKFTMFVACLIGTLCCVIVTVWAEDLNQWVFVLIFFLVGLGLNGPAAVALPLFKEYGDASMTGALVGFGNTGCFLGGGLFQVITSLVLETYGYHKHYPVQAYKLALWGLLAVLGLLATYALTLVRETPTRAMK
jgi:MFS family permease